MRVVTLCSGNAARSVMMGFMLSELSESHGIAMNIRTAGTHVIEGQAISQRTRESMEKLDEMGEHRYGSHRSHQLSEDDTKWADVILAVEANHLSYVRTHHNAAANKTVQIRVFCENATTTEPIRDQISRLASMTPNTDADVADPAGKEQNDYDECARELWALCATFVGLVEVNTDVAEGI